MFLNREVDVSVCVVCVFVTMCSMVLSCFGMYFWCTRFNESVVVCYCTQ